MKTVDDLTTALEEEITRRGPGAVVVLGRLANLLDAMAKARYLDNARKLERSKECDLEQLQTFESVIALIDGLADFDEKKGIYNGIRSGRE